MVINNTNDAFENLLISDANRIKLKITKNINAVFSLNEIDSTVNIIFKTDTKDEYISNKIHLSNYDKDWMDSDTIQNNINYILEKFEDLLNKIFGIAPIGITRWKNSNCIEY